MPLSDHPDSSTDVFARFKRALSDNTERPLPLSEDALYPSSSPSLHGNTDVLTRFKRALSDNTERPRHDSPHHSPYDAAAVSSYAASFQHSTHTASPSPKPDAYGIPVHATPVYPAPLSLKEVSLDEQQQRQQQQKLQQNIEEEWRGMGERGVELKEERKEEQEAEEGSAQKHHAESARKGNTISWMDLSYNFSTAFESTQKEAEERCAPKQHTTAARDNTAREESTISWMNLSYNFSIHPGDSQDSKIVRSYIEELVAGGRSDSKEDAGGGVCAYNEALAECVYGDDPFSIALRESIFRKEEGSMGSGCSRTAHRSSSVERSMQGMGCISPETHDGKDRDNTAGVQVSHANAPLNAPLNRPLFRPCGAVTVLGAWGVWAVQT
ncbi:unnamed protein product, partial [Closterium sp. NIES-65]